PPVLRLPTRPTFAVTWYFVPGWTGKMGPLTHPAEELIPVPETGLNWIAWPVLECELSIQVAVPLRLHESLACEVMRGARLVAATTKRLKVAVLATMPSAQILSITASLIFAVP